MILGFVVSQQGNLRSHLWFFLWLGKNMIIAQKDTQTRSEFDRHTVLLHLKCFSSYLFFRRSFFHRLLTRQASLASSHLERCFSRRSCVAPVMQWERNVKLQSITRAETKDVSVRVGGCEYVI